MRHATTPALDRLEPLLAGLRHIPGLREKSRGVFYRKSSAFLHFHEDKGGPVRGHPPAPTASSIGIASRRMMRGRHSFGSRAKPVSARGELQAASISVWLKSSPLNRSFDPVERAEA